MSEIDLPDDFEKRDISIKEIIRRGNSDI